MSLAHSFGRRGFLQGAAALGVAATMGGVSLGSSQAVAEPAGRIVIGRPADSDNLDPITCVGNPNIFIFNLILEGLVMTSEDGESIELCLAESYEVSEDGTVYTFKVKEGLVFSDGTPVTAADWQFTFDRAIESEDSRWHMCVENIDHVECPDDTTVVVTMKHPAASTLANLCIFTLGVQSKTYFETVGPDEYMNKIIGTGAFQVKEWKKGEYLTLEANPNYRNPEEPLTQEIEFKVVADDSSRTIQLQSGDIDAATDLPFSTLQQLESDPACMPHADASTVTRFLALNTSIETLSKKEVRQALIKATDPQMIVDMALYGYGTAIGTIFSPTSRYCNHDIQPNTPDIEGAVALLAEAGYPNGFDIKILIRGGNDLESQVASVLQAQWSMIGVNLIIEETEATSYKERMYGMDFETLIDYWSDDIQDPSEFMQFIFDFDSACGFDTNFVQPEDMVALNDACNIETDDEKRKEMYAQMQLEFADQAIWVPLFSIPFQNAVRSDIAGFVQTPLGNYRFNGLTRA